MKTIEITEIPPLAPNELSVLDAHSVINTLNVLRCELMLIGEEIAGDSESLRRSIQLSEELLSATHDRQKTLDQAGRIDEFEREILQDLDRCLADRKSDRKSIAASMENIETVLQMLKLRAREVLARAAAPEQWYVFPVQLLETQLRDSLAAIQKTSKRHYQIVLNAALWTERDYYADLHFEAPGGKALLPAVFPDVIRDLTANARKYTAPGGQIIVALHQDSTGTRMRVEDTGCGIPEDELELVVQFGKRASNVASVRTMGGGFGLTKAFFVARQFGGRFWIGSKLNEGTIVQLWLPPGRVS